MIISLILAVVIVIVDQLLKMLVVNTIKMNGTVEILGGIVKFDYVENRGMAFGMLQNYRWIFIIFTLIVIMGLIIYMIKLKPTNKLFITSITLIVGGGIGNLIDRIILGYVVDYIQLSFFNPVCNFADYCITIGTVLLIIYIIFFTQDNNKKTPKTE